MAKKLPAERGQHPRAGQQVRGLRRLVQQPRRLRRRRDRQCRGRARRSTRRRSRPPQIIKDVATSGRADPSLSTTQEDQARLAFEAGKGAFMLNWPYVYAVRARRRRDGDPTAKKVFENMGYARWPGRQQGRAEQGLDRRREHRHLELRPQPGARHAGRAVHDEREVAGPGGDQRGPAAGHELDLRRPGGPQGLPVRRPAARAARATRSCARRRRPTRT